MTNPKLPIVIETLNVITETDPVHGLARTTTYGYADGLYYYTSPSDRMFAGFGEITATDSLGITTKSYFHQGNATDTVRGEYSDAGAKIGKPYRIEYYSGGGLLYKVILNKWDLYNIGSNHDFVNLARTTTLSYDGDATHKDTAEEFTYDTSNGNILQDKKWGEVTASADGAFTDTGSDVSMTTIQYSSNTGAYIVGLPIKKKVVDQSSAPVSETRYYYDNGPYGTVSVGNLTKEEKWKSGSTYVDTQIAYNSYGLPTASTNERGNTTAYQYDTYNLYPATVTNPLSQQTTYTYDYSSGKIKKIIDPNGLLSTISYDGFGRILAENHPDLAVPQAQVVKTAYIYTDVSGGTSVRKSDYLDDTNIVFTYAYLDGFGRKIQERREAENTDEYAVRDFVYNSRGLLEKESLPYSATGSAYSSPSTTAALYTVYSYDPLERVTNTTNSVGTITNAYSDWKTTVTDSRGKVKGYYTDAYGNLVRVDEHNSGSPYSTYYGWNRNGNLLSITDALGNIRNFTYDGLGNRLTAEDLHAAGDATFGTWTYAYDNSGNITQTISPEGKAVNHTYDDANRMASEDYLGTTGTEISYAYDLCTNGIGKLCSVTMASGSDTAYTYDANGNIDSEIKTIASAPYTTYYIYDRQGNLSALGYPDSSQVRYLYNPAGYINQLKKKEPGGSFATLISNVDYSPLGQISLISYANGTITINTYDAMHLYRLSNKTTVNGSSVNLQNISYTYDANSNITQVVDISNTDASKTVNYIYDDLNRLTSATATSVASGQSPYTQTYTYNAIGNIMSGPAGAYVYKGHNGANYANPHAATEINGAINTYDKDGNLLTDGTLTNTWNYKDQLTTSTDGTFTRTYTYDEHGNRVSSSDGTTTTVYPTKYYTYDGTKKTKSVYVGDQLVATIEATGSTTTPYYVHTDHLNSMNVVSDGSGAQVELLDYFPYGSQRISSGVYTNQKQFLSQVYDSDTSLNYLNARYYEGTKGRFISQDPMFWSFDQSWLADPQNQNSYSYARNNPITLSDPTGLSAAGAPMSPFMIVLMYAISPKQTSYDPVYESDQYKAQNDPRNQQMNLTMGWVTGGVGPEAKAISVFKNATIVSEEGYSSFRSFKRNVGTAGEGREWHHIVEQNPTNKAQFEPQLLQNGENLVSIPKDVHYKVSGFYSSKQEFTGGQTVRQWISSQSFEKQMEFGKQTLDRIISNLSKQNGNK
ncbi:MAG: RHS repeat-associated core domain-containing protein [Patescibacteria group bacterium]